MNALNPNPKIFDYKATYPPVPAMFCQSGMTNSFYQGGYLSPFTNNYHESPVHTEKEEIDCLSEMFRHILRMPVVEMEDILPEELR